MPELTDGRELGEAQKLEGVAVQRLPFEGTRYQCAREPLPHTRGLGQVEIAAAAPWLYPKPLQFVLVGLPEVIPREAAGVVDAAEDPKRAHLEAPGEAIEPQVPARLIFGPQDSERHQQLGRNLAAPPFNIMRRRGDRSDVRECRPAHPKVSQFVRKREHLRGLAVRTIDEHQRGEIIGERKATKLVCVEPAIVVVANDATDHHEDAKRIRLLDETAQCIGPRLPPVLQVESERSPDRPRSGLYIAVQLCGSDERKRLIALGARKFAVPFLTLPA